MTISAAIFSHARQDWGTPHALFESLQREFRFDLDAAANAENALLPRWLGPGSAISEDALAPDTHWQTRAYCNPPYGRGTGAWIGKAIDEVCSGHAELVVFLLPSRTDTVWFHRLQAGGAELQFLRGRLTFAGASNSAPFPSLIAILRGKKASA